MEITLSKKTIGSLILFLWLVFSVVYITNDIWSNYKDVQLVLAYDQGRADVINTIIQEAETCQIVPVFSGEKEIMIVNMACLELTQ